MKTDNEKIKELIELSEANSDMKIITMVGYEVCPDDEFKYYTGSIGEIKKDIVYIAEDGVLIGEESIYDHICDKIEEEDCDDDLEEDDYTRLTNTRIEELKASGEIKENIIVYIELPE